MSCSCKDCKYYSQHYKLENGVIKKVMCGYCTKKLRKKKTISVAQCEYFEQNEFIKVRDIEYRELVSELDDIKLKINEIKSKLKKDV